MSSPFENRSVSQKARPSTGIAAAAAELRERLGGTAHDRVAAAIFERAEQIAGRAVRRTKPARFDTDEWLDRLFTSRIAGFPVMFVLLAAVLWVTIAGANHPSAWLAAALFWGQDRLADLFVLVHAPWWLQGFLIDGVYRALAWVVSVMLPPMAIFFPCFTILEDLGYLPRVAFNLDGLLRRVGAHGKQALTMSMGFGCNAAGVVACRIIDSPRERLIAMLTNNFVPCNGRWPTLIMVASLFVGGAVSAAYASLAAAATIVGLTVLGVAATLLVSLVLTRTILKGEVSTFSLELPPYRRPQPLRILYTSLIDRTMYVLWRAVIMAAPAGGLCWLLANIHLGDQSLFARFADGLDPVGRFMGLDGVILMAFIIGLPANEIVVPILIMGYLSQGRMVELDSFEQLRALLVDQHGWTLLTAACVMLFSLLHYPCSTTLLTIFKESGSKKWTLLAFAMPTAIAMVVCSVVAQTARLVGG